MPPKRAIEPSFREKAEKMPRLTNSIRPANVKDSSKTTMSRIQELKRALDKNDNHSHILCLARDIVMTPDLPPQFTMRLLRFCIQVSSEVLMRQLLSTQTVNLKTLEGGQLLWAALEKGQEEIILLLLRSGVDLSIRKPEDNSSVLCEVLRSYKIMNNSKKEEIAKLMLENGVDVNALCDSGYSALHYAITDKGLSSQLVDELLKHGAELSFSKNDDDIFWAACYKSDVLLKLIEHSVPDVSTRNKRGWIAIQTLLLQDYHGAQLADSMRMIKMILDLGVPADTPDPFPDNQRRSSSLLCIALVRKKKDAVKILLDYGADPHQVDERGRTPLYLAPMLKGYTHASRWLIEKGASIHARNDNGTFGAYPIHGACQNNSLRNIHLFVNLGADLNVSDNEGMSPFRYTGDAFHFNDAHYLVIKHFALILAKGGSISDEDDKKANQFVWGNHHFKKCKEELRRMKEENICDEVPYFSLFTKNIFDMIQLMKNSNFVTNFKRNAKKRAELFPIYSYMLLHSFEIAEKRYEVFIAEKEKLKMSIGEAVPDCVLEKKAFLSCSEKLERCQYDFFMTLHANLKNTKTDKEKIL